ncbi:MAG: hypothetical protein IT457_25065 [Planctomycetes bacterium]|nr:hypothetical protein [Planctomycetota bacterium]
MFLEQRSAEKTGIRQRFKEAVALLGCGTGLFLVLMVVFRGLVALWQDLFG